jgi:hypothetical protein
MKWRQQWTMIRNGDGNELQWNQNENGDDITGWKVDRIGLGMGIGIGMK